MKKVFGRWGKHNEGQKEDEVKAITIGAPQGMIHEGHLGFSKEGNFEVCLNKKKKFQENSNPFKYFFRF